MGTVQPPVPRSRRRRWLVTAAVLALLLGLYAVALTWFAHRLQSDMQRSVREAPVGEDYDHRSD